ncbi:MAG: hypothetical protein V3T90_00305, partial [Anaerolineae bacterium]
HTPTPPLTHTPTPPSTPRPSNPATPDPPVWPMLVGLAVVMLFAAAVGTLSRYRGRQYDE